jgi:putative transposase
VYDKVGDKSIANSMQLIQGQTAQQYNERKNRSGAFWQDRYHATAIESGVHLRRCIQYIDHNMVRAEAVEHPLDWHYGGFADIIRNRRRNRIIDYTELIQLLNVSNMDTLQKFIMQLHEEWVKENHTERQKLWTESIAVGSENFVMDIKTGLNERAGNRRARQSDSETFLLKEPKSSTYNDDNMAKIGSIQDENAVFWDISNEKSTS